MKLLLLEVIGMICSPHLGVMITQLMVRVGTPQQLHLYHPPDM
jgi:hypothetical protein